MHTEKELERLREVQAAVAQGFRGLSVRRSEKRQYRGLESAGLVYILHSAIDDTFSVRLTDTGRDY